jgi:hypothetical protein
MTRNKLLKTTLLSYPDYNEIRREWEGDFVQVWGNGGRYLTNINIEKIIDKRYYST